MKYFAFLLLMVFVLACSNDLELNTEYKDIPVVYGLLTPQDTAQYIRIEKAFIDPVISPVQIAQNPDSLYYADLSAHLLRESTGEIYNLSAVDGNLEGYPREDGAFASSPNILYKIRSSQIPLIQGDKYILNIERGDNFPTVTASTTLIEPPLITSPSAVAALKLVPKQITRFSWLKNETSFIYDLKMEFRYLEKDISVPGSIFEARSITWDISTGVNNPTAGDKIEIEIDGVEFHSFLVANLEPGDQFDRRAMDADIILLVGGEELFQFQSVASANLGITSSQDIPTYSNLSEGRGIFSSRTTVLREGLDFTPATQDSLRNGALTTELNFN